MKEIEENVKDELDIDLNMHELAEPMKESKQKYDAAMDLVSAEREYQILLQEPEHRDEMLRQPERPGPAAGDDLCKYCCVSLGRSQRLERVRCSCIDASCLWNSASSLADSGPVRNRSLICW